MAISDLAFAIRNPAPECSFGNLSELTSAGVSCTYSNSEITMSNFNLVAAGVTVNIQLDGIINPPANVAATGDVTIRTRSASGNVIDQKTDITGFTFTTAFSPSTLSLASVTAYPTNQQELAEYEIRFLPLQHVPAGSKVTFTFPGEFGTLPLTANCRVTGGLTTFDTSTVSGLNVFFITDEEYTTGSGYIHFHVYNVHNFNAGSSTKFTGQIELDGTIIEKNDESVGGGVQTIATSAAAADITVTSLDFYPQNEGEKATYEFHFKPAADVASDYAFVVTFPAEFDVDLGSEDLYCTATGLTGSLTCTVNVREVTITGHGGYTQCQTCSISLYIYGALNPAYNSGTATGQFKIGASKDRHYSNYNDNAGTVTFKSAPGYNNVLETLTDSTSSRLETNMQFNITTQQTIPRSSNQGAVWVQYDKEFLLDASEIACRATENWDADPTCTQQYDTVKIVGPNTDFVGNMIIYLSNVQNPRSEITSKTTIVKTYDGLNKQIIDRSYANLNPNRFVYKYPGPLIGVNNDEVLQLNPGRMSDVLTIDFDYPCALNLTLVPSTDDMVFEPYNIETYVGMKSAEFQISVPSDSEIKEYVIDWEVLGDVVPSYYTDISKTEFTVVSGSKTKVRVATIDPISVGTTSPPIRVYVDNAPDQDLTVNIAPVAQTKTDTKMTLSASSLQFLRGQTEMFFTVHLASTIDTSELFNQQLLFSLTGTNSIEFEMNSDDSTFEINGLTPETPYVQSISATDITKTTATVQVTTNTESRIYWAVAPKGTTAPTFSEIQQLLAGEIDAGHFFMYGSAYTYTQSSLITEIAIKGIRADRSYTFYSWLQNNALAPSEQVSVYSFETDTNDLAASFTLSFNQEYVNDDDLNDIQAALQRVLSLPSWRLRTDSVNVSQLRRRRLASSDKSYITMTILGDPESDNYPAPTEIVNRINSQMSTLKTLLPNIDTDQTVQASIITKNECGYHRGNEPIVSEIAATSVTIVTVLNEDAWLYAVAVVTGEDTSEPNPEQIYLGLSSTNEKAVSGSANLVGGTNAELVISGLQPYEFYSIFVTCGNEYPQEPQLPDDDKTVSLPVVLTAKDERKPLDLDSAYFLVSVLLALII